MKQEKTKVTVTLRTSILRRARTITGRGVTGTILAGLRALDRQARRSALRALKGRVSLRSGSRADPALILVDTSAWVLPRTRSHRERRRCPARIDEIALCGPVVTELRRGLRTPAERRRILPLLAGATCWSSRPRLWEDAGDIDFALARRGASVKTLDLLIAAYVPSHDVPILTTDADFARMRSAGIPLGLARVR